MPLEKDQILTPDKKNIVISQVMDEISSIDKAIKEGKLGNEVVNKMRKNKEALQQLLNSLFTKKGVVTPNETNKAIDLLDDAKKTRLEKSFSVSMKKITWSLIGLGVIAGVWIYLSKKNKQ